MRQLILAGFAALMAIPAFSQPTAKTDTTVTVEYSSAKNRVETAPFKSNWFAGFDGGAQIWFGEYDSQCSFGDRLAPALNVHVGKWFTPIVGARLSYSGIGMKGATSVSNPVHSSGNIIPDLNLKEQKFKFWNIHADAMFNLANVFCGYKEEGHFWTPSAFIGLGFAHVYSEAPKGKDITANGGVSNAFRLGKGLDLNVNFGAFLVNEGFDGEVGHRWGEGNFAATVGLTYMFKPRGWGRTKIVKVVQTSDVTDYERAIANLNAEKAGLEKEVAQLKSRPEVVETTNIIASPFYVRFDIGKSKLTKEARVNLGLLADVLKSAGTKVTVSGYADAATGNSKINEKLSRDRAQAVRDCLVNEFGVPESLITVDHKGGVDNMFYNDPALSRAVITKAE